MKSSLTELYLSIRKNLAHSVAGLAPPREIEDIVQEAYVRVCEAEQTQPIHNPKSYLYRTVRNLALDHVKRSEYRLADSLEEDNIVYPGTDSLSDDTFNLVAAREEFAHFCEALRHLPVQCRRVFILKKVYGYSQREIALELDLSESTVEKHIAQGIKRCLMYMEDAGQSRRATAKKTASLVG